MSQLKLEKDRAAAAKMLGARGGKIGGKANTEAQNKARRENGKKGGRPKKIALSYSAYTNNQDGTQFEFFGTVEGAKRKAKEYAHESFPAWGYAGYGPTIVVADAKTGQRLHEERL